MISVIIYFTIAATFISSVSQQELDNFGYHPNLAEIVPPQQAVQPGQGNFYNKNPIKAKPCQHRRIFQNIPTFKSRITWPIILNDNIHFTPQSLSEAGSNLESSVSKGSSNYNQELDPSAASNVYDDLNEFKTRNSLSVNNKDLEPPLSISSDNIIESPSSVANKEDSIMEKYDADENVPVLDFSQAPDGTTPYISSYQDLEPYSESEFNRLGNPRNLESTTDDDKNNVDVSGNDMKKSTDNCVNRSSGSNGILNEPSRRYLSAPKKSSNPSKGQLLVDPSKTKLIHAPQMQKSSTVDTQRDQTQNYDREDIDQDAELSSRENKLSIADNVKEKPIVHSVEPITYRISDMEESSVMLSHSSRVCYACSTASNPTCWHPDRRTTIKYCRQGHNACITKIFNTPYSEILVRDCNDSCNEPDFTGLVPKYKSCSICHKDLCNEAYSVNSHKIMLVVSIISVAKYFLCY